MSVFYIKIYQMFSYGILGNIYTNIDVSVMSQYHLIVLTIDILVGFSQKREIPMIISLF